MKYTSFVSIFANKTYKNLRIVYKKSALYYLNMEMNRNCNKYTKNNNKTTNKNFRLSFLKKSIKSRYTTF